MTFRDVHYGVTVEPITEEYPRFVVARGYIPTEPEDYKDVDVGYLILDRLCAFTVVFGNRSLAVAEREARRRNEGLLNAEEAAELVGLPTQSFTSRFGRGGVKARIPGNNSYPALYHPDDLAAFARPTEAVE